MAKKKSAKKSKSAKPAAKRKVAPIPAGYYTLTPYLVCRAPPRRSSSTRRRSTRRKRSNALARRIDRACRAQDRQLDRDARRRESCDGRDGARDRGRDRNRAVHLHEGRRQGVREGDRRRRQVRDGADGHVLGRPIREARRSVRPQVVDGDAHRGHVAKGNGEARRGSDGADGGGRASRSALPARGPREVVAETTGRVRVHAVHD